MEILAQRIDYFLKSGRSVTLKNKPNGILITAFDGLVYEQELVSGDKFEWLRTTTFEELLD